MPLTRNEMFCLGAGFLAGVAVGAAIPAIRKKIEPFITDAEGKIGDAYSEVAKAVAEQVENIQDVLAERKAPVKDTAESPV